MLRLQSCFYIVSSLLMSKLFSSSSPLVSSALMSRQYQPSRSKILSTSNAKKIKLHSVTTMQGSKTASADHDTNRNHNGSNGVVGFIGCGTIASAIATGIAILTPSSSSFEVQGIAVSKRSETKSKALYEQFPSLVTIHDNNQDILDKADIVFLCVLPQHVSQVLQDLSFDNSRHTLVSLVSTTTINDLTRESKLDSARVSKMICLPSIARHQGVCLHCSPIPNPILTSLFHDMGGVTTLENEDQLKATMITTCSMGPLYGIMKQTQDWLVKNANLESRDASTLVIRQYLAMVQDANDRQEDDNSQLLEELIKEQTPGGLNEQALTNLKQLGGLDAQKQVMDATFSRLKGESDGSIV